MFGFPIPDWAIKACCYLLVAAALIGTGFVFGQRSVYADWLEEKAELATKALKIVTRQGAVTEKVVTRWREKQAETRTVTETIEREVTKYVDSKPLTLACLLDPQWVRLHDAAASALPPATGGTDGASHTAADALQTVTRNYGTYQEVAGRLEALQGWIRGQFEATNGEALGY